MEIYERCLVGIGQFVVMFLTMMIYFCLFLFASTYLPEIKVLQWLLIYHYVNAMLCEALIFGLITWRCVKRMYTLQTLNSILFSLNDMLFNLARKNLIRILEVMKEIEKREVDYGDL